MDANSIVSSIRVLTSKSQKLLTKAQTISLANAPDPYPSVIAALVELANAASNAATDIHGSTTVEGDDATLISDVFKEFVMSQQTVLHLLTSKAQLFKTGQPVADELSIVKDAVESLATNLINHVPSKSSEIKMQHQALAKTMRGSIRAHEHS